MYFKLCFFKLQTILSLIFIPLNLSNYKTNINYSKNLRCFYLKNEISFLRSKIKSDFLEDEDLLERVFFIEDTYSIPRWTLLYMIYCESNFNKDAVNTISFAKGIFQLLPSTHNYLISIYSDSCLKYCDTYHDQLDLLDKYLFKIYTCFKTKLYDNLALSSIYYGHPKNIDPYIYNLSIEAKILRDLKNGSKTYNAVSSDSF